MHHLSLLRGFSDSDSLKKNFSGYASRQDGGCYHLCGADYVDLNEIMDVVGDVESVPDKARMKTKEEAVQDRQESEGYSRSSHPSSSSGRNSPGEHGPACKRKPYGGQLGRP